MIPKLENKGIINNHITGVYGIRSEKIYLDGRVEFIKDEGADFKDITELRELAKSLLIENTDAIKTAKEEKKEWYYQKTLVVL